MEGKRRGEKVRGGGERSERGGGKRRGERGGERVRVEQFVCACVCTSEILVSEPYVYQCVCT